MRKTFDAELLELNEKMTAMAAAAQEAIDVVTESLTTGDEPTAHRAVEIESTMDQMERDIENHCLRLLLRQQPVARDLRTISTAMKMVTDLQRIGDQAANIAEISILLSQGEPDSDTRGYHSDVPPGGGNGEAGHCRLYRAGH